MMLPTQTRSEAVGAGRPSSWFSATTATTAAGSATMVRGGRVLRARGPLRGSLVRSAPRQAPSTQPADAVTVGVARKDCLRHRLPRRNGRSRMLTSLIIPG